MAADMPAKLNAIIERHVAALPPLSPEPPVASDANNLTLLLTGSTGTLGVGLLLALVDEPRVNKIIVLTHSSPEDTKGRVLKVIPQLDTTKLTFVQAKFGEPALGLTEDVYAEIVTKVDAVVHSAWFVNHRYPVEDFEEHLTGVRNMLALSAQSPRHPRVMIISSVTSIGKWNASVDPMPEAVPEDASLAVGTGYAQSKYVAERMLAEATKKYGGAVGATVLRFGQIAGPVSGGSGGSFLKSDWFPTMLRASKHMGVLPDWLRPLDWLPGDIGAAGVKECMLHDEDTRTQAPALRVYNMVNPHATPWGDLRPIVEKRIGPVTPVHIKDWLDKLEEFVKSEKYPADMEAGPCMKLLGLFGGLRSSDGKSATSVKIAYEKTHVAAASKTMRECPPIIEAWITAWMNQMSAFYSI